MLLHIGLKKFLVIVLELIILPEKEGLTDSLVDLFSFRLINFLDGGLVLVSGDHIGELCLCVGPVLVSGADQLDLELVLLLELFVGQLEEFCGGHFNFFWCFNLRNGGV